MKLTVAVISFIMIRFEVLVVIMVVCCMEFTYFILFCVDDVHFFMDMLPFTVWKNGRD